MASSSPGRTLEDTEEVQSLNTAVSDCQDTQEVQTLNTAVSDCQDTQEVQAVSDCQDTQEVQAVSDCQDTQGVQAVSDCQDTQGVQALNTAVSDSQDTQGVQALNTAVSDSQDTQVVQAVSDCQDTQEVQAVSDCQDTQEVLAVSDCQDTQGVQALNTAVNTGNVERVAELLMTCDYSEQIRKSALDSVCGDGILFFDYSRKFREFWRHVGKLLSDSRVNTEHILWAIEETCIRAGDGIVQCSLMPYCPRNHLDTVLPRLVSRGLWGSVGKVLERGVSDTQHRHAVEQAAHRATDREFADYILPHCTDDHLVSVLPHAVSQGLWQSVGKVLERGVSEAQHRHAVEQAAERAEEWEFTVYILPHCIEDLLVLVFPHLVSRGLWQCLGRVLWRGVSETQHRHVVEQAAQKACNKDFVLYILPYCSDEDLVSVFPQLVSRGLWQSVGKVLERGVSEAQHRHAVEQAAERAYYNDFVVYIMPHCSKTDLVSVFPHLVSRGLWCYVGRVLERGVSETQHRHAVEQAAQRACNNDFVLYILPHCSDEDLVSVFPHLVSRGLWQSVGEVLERGVSDAQNRHAVEQAALNASENDFTDYILPNCSDEHLVSVFPQLVSRGQQLGSVLRHLVSRGMWWSVGEVLERGVSDTQHRHAIKQAAESAGYFEFSVYILPYCSDEHLVSVFPHLVSRGLWDFVGEVLERGVSDTQNRHAVEQAALNAGDNDFTDYILSHCIDEHLVSVFPHLVSRGMWQSVGMVLERGVSESQHRHAVEQAADRAAVREFTRYILPHCSDELLVSVFPHLVSRGLWQYVGKVLERSVSEAQHRHAVEQAAQRSNDKDFVDYILPYCNDEHEVSVLPQLVSRGLWQSVGKVLGRGVSDSQRKHALEQAAERADYKALVCFILPQCSDSEMDTVMTRCLSRGLWEPAYLGLNSDDVHFDLDVLNGVCKDLPSPFTLRQLRVLGLNVRVRASLYRNRVRQTVVKAVEEASRTAEEPYFVRFVLPHCKNQQVNTVLTNLVARHMWRSVSKLLEKRDWEKHFQWAVKESVRKANDQDLDDYIVGLFKEVMSLRTDVFDHNQLVSLPWLAEFGRWSVMSKFVYEAVCGAIQLWFDGKSGEIEKRFWTIMTSLIIDTTASFANSLLGQSMKNKDVFVKILTDKYFSSYYPTEEKCDTLFTAVVSVLCCFVCGSGEHVVQAIAELSMYGPAKLDVLKCIVQETDRHLSKVKTRRDLGSAALMIFNALWSVLTTSLPWTTKLILSILNKHTWDMVNSTCLWYCGEPTRRHMFQLAVKEKQWKIVKQWADHTLYDDQRWWALDEAYKDKQWDVMLRLADHGLAELELTKVTNRLIRSADWRIFLAMLERGFDIAEIKATLLQTLSKNAQRNIPSPEGLEKALRKVLTLEDKLKDLKFEVEGADALDTRDWRRVFYFAQRSRAGPSYKLRALKAAIKSKAWHVVIPLIRLGIDTAKHDSLFTGMMKRRQWGVCSALLDLGVSLQVCLDALSELMEMNQWTLVARVMEFNVGDAVRQQVMQRAMERREGSVVWRCISTMDHYRLSVEERQTLFQQAFSHGDWQTIKPLVEMKDDTGIKHRDIAMLAAIEQHQWDVVDYCQLFGADIDMKDELGETPLNRASKLKRNDYAGDPEADWEAVEELVVRDADPNILDRDGCSVLNTAIWGEKWDITKLLIEYLGDIHKTAKCRNKYEHGDPSTPLQLLIRYRLSEVIQHTLMWCPDLWRGVTEDGETTLHALCGAGCENSLYYQVRRGVNPFALTEFGHSALTCAVRSDDNQQKMVAECAKLGFSTHQPRLTDIHTDIEVLEKALGAEKTDDDTFPYVFERVSFEFTSPLLCALLNGFPAVVHMLYESGASSYAELFNVYSVVLDAQDCSSEVDEDDQDDYLTFFNSCKAMLPTLEKMATTPRSLMSSCRLVISHCLDPRYTRQRDVDRLTKKFLSPKMKDYVLFADLAHPDYGKEAITPRFEHVTKLLETIKQMDEEEGGGEEGKKVKTQFAKGAIKAELHIIDKQECEGETQQDSKQKSEEEEEEEEENKEHYFEQVEEIEREDDEEENTEHKENEPDLKVEGNEQEEAQGTDSDLESCAIQKEDDETGRHIKKLRTEKSEEQEQGEENNDNDFEERKEGEKEENTEHEEPDLKVEGNEQEGAEENDSDEESCAIQKQDDETGRPIKKLRTK